MRPKCGIKNCNRNAALVRTNKSTGKATYRKICEHHHKTNIASKAGVTLSEYRQELNLKIAKKQGYNSTTQYRNSKHPYLKYRKSYCENKDGRLGYKCNCTIHDECQLEVDHINGNHNDNRVENLQTLCSNCHRYKTKMKKDNRRNKIKPGNPILIGLEDFLIN